MAQKGQTLFYDDSVVNLVIKGLSKEETKSINTNIVAVDFKDKYIKNIKEENNFLQKEIENKNKQLQSKDEQIESLQIILK